MFGSTANRISHLPVEKILMCLPLQDAPRTSVLSRKWRESIRKQKNKLMAVLRLTSWKGEPYTLPSSLFSRPQLENLALCSCMFKPSPEFKGFSNLFYLELKAAPVNENKISFKEGETSNMVMLFDSLPVILYLEIDYYYVKNLAIGGAPKRLPITLNHLIYPVLSGICFRELDEACVLEAMVIDDPVLELLDAQEWSDVSLNQLRRVHMYNISRTRSELEFIKLLLAKSPMLETMLIEPDWEEVADKGLRILKELTRFPRSSPKAEITYNDSDGGLSEDETSEDEV
ncbi:unnamed protein product [Camellia sinensis]